MGLDVEDVMEGIVKDRFAGSLLSGDKLGRTSVLGPICQQVAVGSGFGSAFGFGCRPIPLHSFFFAA